VLLEAAIWLLFVRVGAKPEDYGGLTPPGPTVFLSVSLRSADIGYFWFRAVEKMKDPDISISLSVSISVLALRPAALEYELARRWYFSYIP